MSVTVMDYSKLFTRNNNNNNRIGKSNMTNGVRIILVSNNMINN